MFALTTFPHLNARRGGSARGLKDLNIAVLVILSVKNDVPKIGKISTISPFFAVPTPKLRLFLCMFPVF
jgi:hypothetical protein